MDETYWVMRRDQVESLASPVRQDICDRLAALGPLSVRDLSEALGRRQTSIYHHLRQMIAVGLVRASRPGSGRGRPATLYETVAPRIRMARSAEIAENRPSIAKGAKAAAINAVANFAAAFDSDQWSDRGPGRNQWFFRVVASPSPERLAHINRLMNELAELLWTADAEPGPPISIAWFLSPLDSKRPAEDRPD
jgi:DNA-binding transcriptional ArsR family regulator